MCVALGLVAAVYDFWITVYDFVLARCVVKSL
jgi:hypothetical protein